MNLTEMNERLEAIDAELSNIVAQIDEPVEGEERAETEELETRSNELMEERQNILADIEKAEAEIAEEKRAMEEVIANKEVIELEKREDTKMTDMEIRNSAEYIDAYAEYLKTGDDSECRALLTENGTNGTIAVPELVDDLVRNAWEKNEITRRVKKTYLKGNLKINFEISGSDAVVPGEGQAASEETLVEGMVTMIPEMITKWVKVSKEAYKMRGEAFIRYLYDELAYQISRKAVKILLTKIIACGTVSTTTCVSVPVVVSTTVGAGVIAKGMAKLSDQAENPVVLINRESWGDFMAAKYAGNFDADPFEGLPVLFSNQITAFTAATTGVPYAIVGDLETGAQFNFPDGEEIEFIFDEVTDAASNLIRVYGSEYVAIDVVAPNAFVKITK